MSKCEKQVVTKLNKKLDKYGLTREELELKLHSASLYGSTVMKYCYNHDVLCGTYDCNYATVVNNSIMCTAESCWYQYNKYSDPLNKSMVVDNSYEDEDDECLSCPYFNPEAPDCCTYAPEACYYDTDPDKYPF